MGKYDALFSVGNQQQPQQGKYSALFSVPDTTTTNIQEQQPISSGVTRSFDETPTLSESITPRGSQVPMGKENIVKGGTADFLDAASLVGRLATAIAKTGVENIENIDLDEQAKQTISERLGMTWDKFKTELAKTKATQGGIGGFIENIIRDPATFVTSGTAGAFKGLAGGALKKAAAAGGIGAIEGAVSAATHQAENVVQDRPIDFKEAAIETGTSAALGAGGSLLTSAASGLNKLVGRLSEWTTGVDEKALRKATTKQGREVLKQAFDTQEEIGEQLVDMVNNAIDYMPDASKINNALDNMPAVNAVPVIKKMERYINRPITKEFKQVQKQLMGKAEELRILVSETGDAGYVPAREMVNFRKELDYILSDQFGKESSSKFISSLKTIRHDIKESLVDASKGTEYAATMKEFSERLSTIDKMKKLLGRDVNTRELSGEKFINSLNNKGRKKAKQWVSEFQKVFGGDFVERAQLAKWADQFGDEGSGAWLPRWTTGRSLWAKGAGIAVGSPKVATRITLPATQAAEGIAKKSGTAQRLTRQAVRTSIFDDFESE